MTGVNCKLYIKKCSYISISTLSGATTHFNHCLQTPITGSLRKSIQTVLVIDQKYFNQNDIIDRNCSSQQGIIDQKYSGQQGIIDRNSSGL